jgi:hypothetical protein
LPLVEMEQTAPVCNEWKQILVVPGPACLVALGVLVLGEGSHAGLGPAIQRTGPRWTIYHDGSSH